jgi:plastocyanin
MRTRPSLLLGLCAALVTPGLVACGSSSSTSGTATTVPGAGALAVTAKSFSFTPKEIDVKAGSTATLSLHSTDLAHDFTVKELDIHVAVQGGKTTSKSITFDKPGTYTFYCSVAGHREAGMEGTLVVL